MSNLKDMVNKKTCWYDPNLYTRVNIFTKAEPPLEELAHGKVLKELFNLLPNDAESVLDIGCGNAKANTIIGRYRTYTGLDLPNNIETIAKVNYPDLEYIKCDLMGDYDLRFIITYDVVLMNAFIDVMQFPLLILIKILRECGNYVIIHRQEIHNGSTDTLINPSYSGFTYHTMLSAATFNWILNKYNFEIIYETDAGFGGNWRSFILKKNEIR